MADITTWTPITAPTDFRDDKVFDIDFKTKTVQVLVEQPIVAGENLSQFIKFQAPRYYDNIDLTNMTVNILYVSPAGNTGISAAVNTEYSDDMIRCGWLVPYAACPEKGTLLFVLEFVGADYVLKTTIGSTPVLDSINDADVIPEPVEQTWYITLQANVSAALQEAQTALGRIESIFNALSAPMSASTAVDMVDESAIYVYTGSETGYTYGNWYYYDGTEWTSGGAYASTALVTDRTLSKSGQAADALETGRRIEELSSDLSDISTTGINLFDKSKALLNRAVNLSGVEYTANNFYCTDYISVVPSTNYRIAVGIGSASAYLTCAFYDSSKNFISGSFNSKITEYTVTTPENCAYLRINGAIVRIDTQMVSLAGVNRFSDYQRIISGSGQRGVSLVSPSEIFYNKTTGTLTAKNAMSIVTPDNAFNIGTSVNVGTTGGYLYWNKRDGTLYTSATNDTGAEIYLLATLTATREFESHKQYCTLDSAFPIFKLDLYSNKLIVQVNGRPCYLLYNGTYYAIPADFYQEITLTNHCAVIYSPGSDSFEVVSEFTNYALSKGIPVMTRYYTQITCRVPYETIINDGSYKNFVCYGDSLTWYDGHAFTWGEHQGETCIGFESYIRNDLQARAVANRGESGKTTPQICGKILTATDLSDYDVMTIMGGDNDDRLEVSTGTVQPIGGSFDTSTVCGALQSAIEYALGQNPNLRIILMTEPMGWTYQDGAMDRVSELVPNAYKNVAKQYGLPLIDLWGESGINELTRETFYADPAPSGNQLYMYHPNNKGWIRCSKIIVKKIKGYI